MQKKAAAIAATVAFAQPYKTGSQEPSSKSIFSPPPCNSPLFTSEEAGGRGKLQTQKGGEGEGREVGWGASSETC